MSTVCATLLAILLGVACGQLLANPSQHSQMELDCASELGVSGSCTADAPDHASMLQSRLGTSDEQLGNGPWDDVLKAADKAAEAATAAATAVKNIAKAMKQKGPSSPPAPPAPQPNPSPVQPRPQPAQEPTPAPNPPPANDVASGATGSLGTPGKVPETIPDRFLNCHNYWRCIHGSPPIKWDKDVAQGAQQWANRGQMSHSDCYHIPPPQGPTGENLASGSSMSPEQACKMWHDENPDRGPNCGGHCTAMLWKSAFKLGCGIKGGLVVCRYGGKSLRDGTPNFGGRSEYRQNVGYPDNSKEGECKKKWPQSTKGSANPGGGGGNNPFGGGGGRGSGGPSGGGSGGRGSGQGSGGWGGWR